MQDAQKVRRPKELKSAVGHGEETQRDTKNYKIKHYSVIKSKYLAISHLLLQ
jgi:hypothetical protein